MPRVVTTSRYVTTLGFMAYLTGTQVASPEADNARKKGAHLATRDSNGRQGTRQRLSNLRVRWDVENVTGLVLQHSKETARRLGVDSRRGPHCLTRQTDKGAPGPRVPWASRRPAMPQRLVSRPRHIAPCSWATLIDVPSVSDE
ncbi:hypothetical protein X777_15015 [Ooceraea biroi]|uniref:Uncharacterized protein n=1 Tax=Ooceraea biroi TaxID=2015173 RepID=A0A026WT38_OOCBI|nr:hypothetical protein X777_15015 [Ooceraea biroi]